MYDSIGLDIQQAHLFIFQGSHQQFAIPAGELTVVHKSIPHTAMDGFQ